MHDTQDIAHQQKKNDKYRQSKLHRKYKRILA